MTEVSYLTVRSKLAEMEPMLQKLVKTGEGLEETKTHFREWSRLYDQLPENYKSDYDLGQIKRFKEFFLEGKMYEEVKDYDDRRFAEDWPELTAFQKQAWLEFHAHYRLMWQFQELYSTLYSRCHLWTPGAEWCHRRILLWIAKEKLTLDEYVMLKKKKIDKLWKPVHDLIDKAEKPYARDKEMSADERQQYQDAMHWLWKMESAASEIDDIITERHLDAYYD